jgi:hypothetical protein
MSGAPMRAGFATTVGEVEQFEGIEVQEPRHGLQDSTDDLLSLAEDAPTASRSTF